jgi:hypothetical protein
MNKSLLIFLLSIIPLFFIGSGVGLYFALRPSTENTKLNSNELNDSEITIEYNNVQNPDEENIDEEERDFKQTKKNVKTQKNRKSTGSSRRRY